MLRGFLKPYTKAEADKIAKEYIELLNIKTASADTPIKSLSGGNQQKVILAIVMTLVAVFGIQPMIATPDPVYGRTFYRSMDQ